MLHDTSDRLAPNPQQQFEENFVEMIIDFTPVPFGHDLFAQFGDYSALPVVGNFDPPVVGDDSVSYEFLEYTNPDDPLDVNGDGVRSPGDALAIINALNSGATGDLPTIRIEEQGKGPYLDTDENQFLSSRDALLIIDALNRELLQAHGDAEGELGTVTKVHLYSDGPSTTDSAVESLLGHLAVPRNASVTSAGDGENRDHVVSISAQSPVLPVTSDEPAESTVDTVVARTAEPEVNDLLDLLAEDVSEAWTNDSLGTQVF